MQMINAIARRESFEKLISEKDLAKDVDNEDVKLEEWVKSKDELKQRLLMVKALQLATAKKLSDETRDVFIKRIDKCRKKTEEEIIGNTELERKQMILVYVLKSFASSLDSHTNYLTPQEASQFMIQVQQMLVGIGAELRDDLDGFKITRILEKGPADKSKKLKINDKIIAVDKEPVVGMNIVDAVELIRGSRGSEVILTILRDKEKMDVKITRGEIVLEDTRIEKSFIEYGDGIIGYLKLFSFYQDPKSSSAEDMKKAIREFSKGNIIKGLVLDLRNNSGGLLPQAVDVAGLFITKGVVVAIKDSDENVERQRNTDGRVEYDGPLVVLTNKMSASAAEIVAQALQDYGRAVVVGDRHTFGKGSFQTCSMNISRANNINPQGEYKVTKGRYYTVSGKSPQLTGVKVDVEIPGVFSEMKVGEKYAKFPLETDQISSMFDDDLMDIPAFKRKQLGFILYKHNLQKKTEKYTRYMDILKSNSKKRIDRNKCYQQFIKDISFKKQTSFLDYCLDVDIQLIEAYDVTKDLIYLVDTENKQFASFF